MVQFTVEYEAAGMIISIFKSEAVVLSQKRVGAHFRPRQAGLLYLGSKCATGKWEGGVERLQQCGCCTGPLWWSGHHNPDSDKQMEGWIYKIHLNAHLTCLF